VQTAVSTVKEVREFRKTRKLFGWDWSGVVTRATEFGFASAPPTGTETVRPVTEPPTTGSA
jgi:hypothetical protein